jgi:hypothetical protein
MCDLVITTSFVQSHPCTEIIDRTIESCDKLNIPFNKKFIVYDYNNNKNYKLYKNILKKHYTDVIGTIGTIHGLLGCDRNHPWTIGM